MAHRSKGAKIQEARFLYNAVLLHKSERSGWRRMFFRLVMTICMVALGGTMGASFVSAAKDSDRDKVVYLSFDDGPGKHTPEVLDILRKENVPATFFVLGEQAELHPKQIRRILKEGHALGNHTYNHRYNELYRDFQTFWAQIKRTEEVIHDITGIRPDLVRAPGGTYGHFDQNYFDLLKRGGYTVMDWNVDSGDSKRKNVPAKEILRNATHVTAGTNSVVVLMHDGGAHAETVKALPGIIQYYRDHGYRFDVMSSSDQEPVQFRVHPSEKYKSRQAPSKTWIAQHVDPNRQLWTTAKKELKVEIGLLTAELGQDEFRMSDRQIMVPLRHFLKTIGGTASWDAKSRTATVLWKNRMVQVDPSGGWMTTKRWHDSEERAVQAKVEIHGGTIWVPLRELLEQMGASIHSTQSTAAEWVIKASPPLTSIAYWRFYDVI